MTSIYMFLVLYCNFVCLCVCPTGSRQDPPMYHINMDHVGKYFCETIGQLYLNPWDQPIVCVLLISPYGSMC